MNNGGKIEIAAFTAGGAALAEKLALALPDGQAHAPQRYLRPNMQPLEEDIGAWAKNRFDSSRALIFIGAAGIAVRAVGPLVVSKGSDPAVICMDVAGHYVIPLLSGHIGGANALAREIAGITGGVAVITTATDVNQVFAPDDWAARQGCVIPHTGQIKALSAALLDGESVGLISDFPIEGNLPKQVEKGNFPKAGMYIGLKERQPFEHTLWIVPKCIWLGVGCRRNIPAEVLESVVLETLEKLEIPLEAVIGVASIDLKQEELALLSFCGAYHIPLAFFSAQELIEVQGSTAGSSFVEEVTGVDNVCERAALAQGGRLILEKTARNGVTVAAAKLDWRADFCNW